MSDPKRDHTEEYQNNQMVCMYEAALDTPNIKSATDLFFRYVLIEIRLDTYLYPRKWQVTNNKWERFGAICDIFSY